MSTRTTLPEALGKTVRRLRRPSGRPAERASEGSEPDGPQGPPRTAILIVNGFDRRGRFGEYNAEEARQFPWIRLCMRQIRRHSQGSSYEVLVWDNSFIHRQRKFLRNHPRVRLFRAKDPEQNLPHGTSLERLVRKVHPDTEFIITLDTDSFPIRDGWIENLTGRLNDEVLLAGAWRDELLPRKPAYVHPCCLAVRVETLKRLRTGFKIRDGVDVGHNINVAVDKAGGQSSRLYRSNKWNPHFLMGAIYGDLVYHQGAGSRNPRFARGGPSEKHEEIRQALRDAAFGNLDELLGALAGNLPPDVVPEVVRAAETAPQPKGPRNDPEAAAKEA